MTREAGKLGDIVKMIGLVMVAALGASETDLVVVRRNKVHFREERLVPGLEVAEGQCGKRKSVQKRCSIGFSEVVA